MVTLTQDISNNEGVTLTVGKIESGLAVVVTDDLQILEIPSSLIPPSTHPSGTIIRLSVTSAREIQQARHSHFMQLQNEILLEFGGIPDSGKISNCLGLVRKSHTTVTLGWTSWGEVCPESKATIYGLDVYCDHSKMAVSVSPWETALKLSGLEPAQTYSFRLRFRTSAGAFPTNELIVTTSALDDFTCLNIVADHLPPELLEKLESLKVSLQDKVDPESTNLVVTKRNGKELKEGDDDGELLQICRECDIPMVTEDWVKSCLENKSMQNLAKYYVSLDASD